MMLLSELKEVLWQSPRQVLGSDEQCLRCSATIDSTARTVARTLDRESAVREINEASNTSVWHQLGLYWQETASAFSQTSTSLYASEDSRIDLGLSLAKLERNLIAGLVEHQRAAIAHEPSIRSVIFHLTTFGRIEDPRFFPLQAMLSQLLSNLISPVSTSAEANRITDKILDIYLSGNREDDVIIRLLDSRDAKVNHATLQLLVNITRGSEQRMEKLLRPAGLQWLSRILGRMDSWLDDNDGRFELACLLFEGYIQTTLHCQLFEVLAIPSEPITPSQASLLKIVDSHLSRPHDNPPQCPLDFLIPLFHTLAEYAIVSMTSSVDDGRLPRVFEGLVLAGEGLGSIGLAVQGRRDKGEVSEVGEEQMVVRMKSGPTNIVKPLVAVLKELTAFMPRLRPDLANPVSTSAPSERSLSGIKVTLVKLIGILSFEDTSVGDMVREEGGVQLVLGMTEVDERNPYLREHALFAVRNLLLDNPANQAIVTRMDPIGVMSETGDVLPLPERMKPASVNGSAATS